MSNEFKVGDQVYVSDIAYEVKGYGKIVKILKNISTTKYLVELQVGGTIIANPEDMRLSDVLNNPEIMSNLERRYQEQINKPDLKAEKFIKQAKFALNLEKENKVLKQDNESLVIALANINDLHSEEQSKNRELQKQLADFNQLKSEYEDLQVRLAKMTDDRNHWKSEYSVLIEDYESLENEVSDLDSRVNVLEQKNTTQKAEIDRLLDLSFRDKYS